MRTSRTQDLYSETHGRPSVLPSQMATLLLLQYYDRVSDGEAVDRSAFDLRWAVALRRVAGTRLCGRATLVEFRARLALRDGDEQVFDAILRRAREQGLLSTRPLRVLLDTRAVLGRGAVEDTDNLLARAMDLLLKVLAHAAQEPEAVWAARQGLAAYVRRRDTSLKGQADVDSDQPASRRRFLRRVGVEHAFARLARLGLGQARYFGRAKTRFQVVMTCAAANLRLLLCWEAAQAAASA